jgi:hypothetical protein
MTYPDDPNFERRHRIDDPQRSSTGMWVAGVAALALVLGILIFGFSNRGRNVASNTPPATTSTTTGAGGTAIPANPSGTATQKDVPASTPAKPTPAR